MHACAFIRALFDTSQLTVSQQQGELLFLGASRTRIGDRLVRYISGRLPARLRCRRIVPVLQACAQVYVRFESKLRF